MSSFEVPQVRDLPGNGAGPVFLEPWHAEAFSLVVTLHRQGAFGWNEWVELFSDTLRDVPAESGESVESAHYRRWLLTLESIVARKRLASVEEMTQRKEEWRHAYLHTPHGEPMELRRPPAAIELHESQHHSHAAHPAPIAVSPSRHSGTV